MKKQLKLKTPKTHSQTPNTRAMETERKRQKQESLRWISGNAVSIFRQTWRT
jgi:hypothetical protein